MQDTPVVTIPQVQVRAASVQEHFHNPFVAAQDGPVQRCATERVCSVDAGAVGKEERGYGCVTVHGGQVEGRTAGTVGFVGIEFVRKEDGEDGGVTPVQGDVQNGHGVIIFVDFGVGGFAAAAVAAIAAGGTGAVAAVAAAIVIFAAWVVWGVSSGFWRLLGCRQWDLVVGISDDRKIILRF